MSVLVNVEPEGVVAIPGKQETEYIIFNIGTPVFYSNALHFLHQEKLLHRFFSFYFVHSM